MATIDRTAYLRFRQRLTQDELSAYYTVSEGEVGFIRSSAKGKRPILIIAVLLKTRQQLGYFSALGDVPAEITLYIAEQLNAAIGSPAILTSQRASLSRYRSSIRRYLQSKPYSSGGQPCATDAVQTAALTMSDPADLINVAVESLVKANIELPAFSTLSRLVGHLREATHRQLYSQMTESLTRAQMHTLNSLLLVVPGQPVTRFNQLKQSSGTPTLNNIL